MFGVEETMSAFFVLKVATVVSNSLPPFKAVVSLVNVCLDNALGVYVLVPKDSGVLLGGVIEVVFNAVASKVVSAVDADLDKILVFFCNDSCYAFNGCFWSKRDRWFFYLYK